MTLLEILCLVTICLVIVFGIVSVTLLESAVHDMELLQTRQDRLETKIYVLDKFFQKHLSDNINHEQQRED